MESIKLSSDYVRAVRLWRANNLKSSLLVSEQLSQFVQTKLAAGGGEPISSQLLRLKHLIWFLKIRCLAEDDYLDESLLLDEEDVEAEEQVRVFASGKPAAGSSSQARNLQSSRADLPSRRTKTALVTARRTAVLTGRMASRLSRQASSRASSSYRPLTTNLTASQAAFSRSTRLLLKYSTCRMLSKLAFEYLYNAQSASSRCPDYRQCLEYLNLVQASQTKHRKQQAANKFARVGELQQSNKQLSSAFWLLALGSCYFKLHMNKQAEEQFLRALTANPKHLDAYAWLVKVYLRANQPAKVLRVCRDGLAASKNQILYNWMARVQALSGDLYAANANLRESLSFHPTNIEALANVAHFNFYGDKMEQALKCFERIQQLSLNQSSVKLDAGALGDTSGVDYGNSSQLLNNLALCNFYSGNLNKVMPLFSRALLNSPSREVSSTIWYNISFVCLGAGFKNLALACLRLALKNNSQNEEAINNLGVLKYQALINEELHFPNKQELWGCAAKQPPADSTEESPANAQPELQQSRRRLFDAAESYFGKPGDCLDNFEQIQEDRLESQPETLYNMALVKRRRGQLLAAATYCNLYLQHDPNNQHIRGIMTEIRQIVSHDG